ncbi:hypothetical protein LCGC14_1922450 [marine sediment metagenome]|uniref:Uncharacterized protein n=1 Tax=marine sediment metagenome TaxID=412755 RepID=A0A0F9FQ58_9ZZZZ
MSSGHPDREDGSPSWGDDPPHGEFANDPIYQAEKRRIRGERIRRKHIDTDWRSQWTKKGIRRRMTEYRGLTEVLVETGALLETVKENYALHRQKFEEAMDGYKIKVIELLEEHIQRIRDNAPEKVFIQLPMPEDHSKDYERVIEMLKWSGDTHLVLDESEFATYVLDQWGWQEGFSQTYAMYSSSG